MVLFCPIFKPLLFIEFVKGLKMAKSLSQRLTDIQDAIVYVQGGRVSEYRTGLSSVVRLPLSVLYKQEKELIEKINIYGGDFVEGANAKPSIRSNHIVFNENI